MYLHKRRLKGWRMTDFILAILAASLLFCGIVLVAFNQKFHRIENTLGLLELKVDVVVYLLNTEGGKYD